MNRKHCDVLLLPVVRLHRQEAKSGRKINRRMPGSMHELLTGHSTSEQTNRKRVFALFCLKIMIIGVYGTANIGKN